MILALVAVALCATAQADGTSAVQAADPYLMVWTADHDDQHSDFLAVLNANPLSPDYGKLIKTYTLPVGVDKINEPHHMTHHVTPNCKLFAGGLLSGNTFVFDVRDPLNVPAPKVLRAGIDYPFTVPDDFKILPNGNVLGTYVGAGNLMSPGGVVEFDPDGNVVDYFPVGDINDSSANPHGIALKTDINRLVTSDFGVPITLFFSFDFYDIATHTSVRIWDLENRQLLHRIELPEGPRFAATGDPKERANFAVMEVGFLNGPGKTGFFASAMGGGGLFYCPDATAAAPECHLVYDYGYDSGPGAIAITKDDRFLIQPLSTVGQMIGEKKIVQLDITDPMNPVLVNEVIVPDDTTGGPHFGTFDEAEERFAWSNYFVDDFRIPVDVDGNHRVHIARFNGERLVMDRSFRDEIDGEVGINFNRISWPHGDTGFAAPHGVVFVPASCTPTDGHDSHDH